MAESPQVHPPNTFHAEVSVPQRGPDGKPLDSKRVIGKFVFKAPTLQETIDIGLRRTKFLKGTPPLQVGGDTLYFADSLATLPAVIIEGPTGWTTEQEIGAQRNQEEVQAVYQAYIDGLERFHAGAK